VCGPQHTLIGREEEKQRKDGKKTDYSFFLVMIVLTGEEEVRKLQKTLTEDVKKT
jgi:hypothetical protein